MTPIDVGKTLVKTIAADVIEPGFHQDISMNFVYPCYEKHELGNMYK